MSAGRDVAALVAAAGSGTRLGLGPKAFLALDGRTLLERVADVARSVADEVAVAVPGDRIDAARALLPGTIQIIAGGATRTESFQRLAAATRAPWVLLLDVSRPFASAALLAAVLDAARAHGAAGAFVRPKVPAALPAREQAGGAFVVGALPACDFLQPQMPQAFRRELLERALEHSARTGLRTQTIWELFVAARIPLAVVEGEDHNIKITTELDWATARDVIAPRLRRGT